MKKLSMILLILIVALTGCQPKENVETIIPITDEGEEWNAILREQNELSQDINHDGQSDTIKIEYEEKEGTLYISKFMIAISGDQNEYKIENYDASFEKMELIDINQDGSSEILFLFDTHGGGGQGTHDIFLFDNSGLKQISSELDTEIKIEDGTDVDAIYSLEKVSYGGKEKLLVRQYLYGKEGHADGIGDVVSVVSLNPEENSFYAEESWIENY